MTGKLIKELDQGCSTLVSIALHRFCKQLSNHRVERRAVLVSIRSSLSQQLLVERQRDIFHEHIIRVHSHTVKQCDAREFVKLRVENETLQTTT